MDEVRFEVELEDGRVAQCWLACAQSYQDYEFSAGLVDSLGTDTLYLRIRRGEEDEPLILFLRPDEALAIVHLLSGALWSSEMLRMKEEGDGSKDTG